jgi:polyisoprenyl-teichoic acid--peptidoglycan teichoic acid transferase
MRKFVAWFAAGVVVLVGTAAGVTYWQARAAIDQFQAGPKDAVVKAVRPELHKPPRRVLVPVPVEPSAQTILLIGSDHRWSGGGGGARSDTIMLARVDPHRHRIGLLSIPRDLYVSIPGHGHDRINMAFEEGGERLLTRVVRETFGVSIDHFVEIDFHGFKDIVSQLGGVWIPVDRRYYNRNIGTAATNYANIDLKPGYQRLNGVQALAYARYRHDDNDFVRAARQQLLLRIVAHDAMGDAWNIFRVRRLAFAAARATTSDISGIGEVISLARAVHDTASSNVVRITVPAGDLVLNGADYLQASPAQLRGSVRGWLGLSRRHAAAVHRLVKQHVVGTNLVADGGRSRSLLASVANGMRTCAPTQLPPGFVWPSDAVRSYTLARHPAIALYATAGSGDSLLWMFTTWRDPPILGGPATTIERGGRRLDLYTTAGKVHQIAWQIGATRVWLMNTLRDALSNNEMFALASSCR